MKPARKMMIKSRKWENSIDFSIGAEKMSRSDYPLLTIWINLVNAESHPVPGVRARAC